MPRPKPPSLPVLHIMLVLADGAAHGYAIKQAVEDGGLIEAAPLRAEPANGQEAQRRYYQLTPLGWTSLRTELRALGTLIDAARANPRLRKGLA